MEKSEGKNRFVLIDTDVGTDDALAIMMAVAAHRDSTSPVKIVGIICANGNTCVNNVATNVFRTLQTLNEDNIPVFLGATQPLVHPFSCSIESFHGSDGFGDCFSPLDYKQFPNFQEEHGVVSLCRLAKEHEGKLTVLALAPLTNLAMAARLDPEICQKLEAVYMMGGNVEGDGNATVSAEYNFAVDPEAAFITLSSFSCPIYVVPWEVTVKAMFPWEWRTKVLGSVNSPQTALLNAVEKAILERETKGWIACDQFAAAAVIDPKVMKKTVNCHCTVELSGNFTRGLMVVDNMGILKKPNNVVIVKELDEEMAKRMMLWAVHGCKHYKTD